MAGNRDDIEGPRRRRSRGGGGVLRFSCTSLCAQRICVLLLLLSPSHSFPGREGGDELNSSYDDWKRRRRVDREKEGGDSPEVDAGRRQSRQLQSRRRQLQGPTSPDPTPAQSYFVPLREYDVAYALDGISSADLSNDAILTRISVATSVDGTVVWYDHWEDGYDDGDPTDPAQQSNTTLVLGDGDPDNGCVEMIRKRREDPPVWNYVCTSDDVDLIGQYEVLVFINEAAVATPRNETEVLYDGGDSILSSFPVTVTRMAHSTTEDYLVTSMEVFEAQTYAGKTFRAPFGEDSNQPSTGTFELVQLHVMAVEMGPTEITYDGTVVAALSGKGETIIIDHYGQFKKLESDKDVQVTLVTGDRDSREIRVFSLLPVSKWGSEYFDPVSSDSKTDATIWIHRVAGNGTKWLTHESLANTLIFPYGDGSPAEGAGGFLTSANSATGTRVSLSDDEAFLALSIMDQPTNALVANITLGATYDWGHPLLPVDMLTSRAVVGWGIGCTENSCNVNGERSVVFVTPVEDAEIYVDYDGDGTYEESHTVVRLGQLTLTDDADEDMTGAVLFANNSVTGDGVKFAAAWGQSPILSGGGDEHGLDMGTTIMPVPDFAASVILSVYDDHGTVGTNRVSPGDTLKVTVRIANTRGSHAGPIPPGTVSVILDDPSLFNHTDYVPTSAQYTDDLGNVVGIPDGLLPNTAFPLDEGGVSNQVALSDGTAHVITFLVEVKQTPWLTSNVIELRGRLVDSTDGAEISFLAQVRMTIEAELKIEQVAYRGEGDNVLCADAFTAAEAKAQDGAGNDDLLYAPPDSDVTYCYRVTNTGDAYLDQMNLTDSFGTVWGDNGGPAVMAPGDVANLFTAHTLDSVSDRVNNRVKVNGRPRLLNGYELPEGVQSFDQEYIVTARAVAYDMNSPLHCESFNHTMTQSYLLTNFEFVAYSTECVNVRVFMNSRPPSADEESVGKLEDDWTLMCRAAVQGSGGSLTNKTKTNIPPEFCSPTFLINGTTVHFYVSAREVNQTECDNVSGLSGTDYGVLVAKVTDGAGACAVAVEGDDRL